MEIQTKQALERLSEQLQQDRGLEALIQDPALERLMRQVLTQAVSLLEAQESLPEELTILATNKALTTGEAASLLSVSIPTVRKLVARGDLQGYRVGAHLRVPAESVEHYLKAREAGESAMDTLVGLSDELRDLGL